MKSELHYWLKKEHIPAELFDTSGEPPSSADLGVEQFSDFLEAVLRHAGEERVYIPLPNRGASE